MTSLPRRTLLAGGAAAAATSLWPAMPARAQSLPGVTATEIKIGSTGPLSGPVSVMATMHKTQAAYFRMLNEQGGIAGRKIQYVVYDDGFSPPKTLEQTRRLVERDEVALLFGQVGTGPNSAIVKYVNAKGVPHLFLTVNGDKWGDHKVYPWTIPFAPSGRGETRIFVQHALAQNPAAKIAILYQNDDFGRDYVAGAKDVLGARYDTIVKAASYEVTDPTIDSQLIQLQSSGADVLISGVAGRFGALTIRKVHDLGWKPAHYLSNGAASITGTITPAGPERAIGVVCTAYLKDPSAPQWAADEAVKTYKAFMAKHYADGDANDAFNYYAYTVAQAMRQVLEQCKGDFERKNILLQANSLKDVALPMLLPGITLNTAPDNHHPIRQVQLQKWDGRAWQLFGGIVSSS